MENEEKNLTSYTTELIEDYLDNLEMVSSIDEMLNILEGDN